MRRQYSHCVFGGVEEFARGEEVGKSLTNGRTVGWEVPTYQISEEEDQRATREIERSAEYQSVSQMDGDE